MKNTILSIRTAASLIREAGLTPEDINDASEFIPELRQKISMLKAWLDGQMPGKVSTPTPTPVVEETPIITTKTTTSKAPWLECGFKGTTWQLSGSGHNVMVSTLGEVYDLTNNKPADEIVLKGHLNVVINGCFCRLENIVAATYHIDRPANSAEATLICFRDGNIRNCKASNLMRVERSKVPVEFSSDNNRDVLDISNMILLHKGRIDEIMEEYPEQRRTTSFKGIIANIRDKREFAEISDKVFINVGGELFPADPNAAKDSNEGVDTVSLLIISKDIVMVGSLLGQKIKNGTPITKYETAILVFKYVKRGFKSSSTIREKISADYKITIPPKTISEILNTTNTDSLMNKIKTIIMEG